ncbi:MAG TPA: hypothetical protein VFV75_11365 [Candidatus Polarisedimenticolaceae bacterium]|nr:hypothetical protein [Candidatus Polarisedimenticolaceae bacterium]
MRGRMLLGLVALGAAGLALAQVKTDTATETGRSLQAIQVERGEVWYVSGNDLVVKMEDGTLRNFMNVPDDVRATVDGKQLSVRELKPGMKLQRTITTTMTPAVITTVQTVTGTVFSVSPPKSVVLTLEDGTNQSFDIPKGQQFDVQGKTVDAFGLKRGMKVSAAKIIQTPATMTAQQRAVTGSMPPPPPPNTPILIAQSEPVPAPPPPEAPKPEKLPVTGSLVPLLGLVGAASLGLGLALGVLRRRRTV